MTPNQMRKKADEIEAAGGPNATERANALRDRANDMEEEGYQKSGGGYGMKKGGKVPKGMHRMPDGKMMKDSEHKKKKPKKMMGGGTMKYAHGGSIDGVAVRGKTRGRMC